MTRDRWSLRLCHCQKVKWIEFQKLNSDPRLKSTISRTSHKRSIWSSTLHSFKLWNKYALTLYMYHLMNFLLLENDILEEIQVDTWLQNLQLPYLSTNFIKEEILIVKTSNSEFISNINFYYLKLNLQNTSVSILMFSCLLNNLF